MASTLTGPIRIPQINRYYYVGEPMQRNIQQAVTFAIRDSNDGTVIIAQDYTGTDSIAAVTGGSPTVFIVDERHGQRQTYLWYNGAYVYESIHPLGGILTPRINSFAYVGFGVYQTIQSAIDAFAALPTLKIIIVIEPTYTGSELIEDLTGGDPGIILSDQRTGQWQNYEWDGTDFVPSDFEPLGQIIADSITAASIDVASLTAGDAEFDTCFVDNSPVRTFANTADGPSEGMIWPEFGIPVSQGDHWQDPSIDPATLATWPPTGIAVSTGTAWGAAIAPTTIPRLNTPNVFTANQSVTGTITASGAIASESATGYLRAGPDASNPADAPDPTIPQGRLLLAINGHAGLAFGGQFVFATSSSNTWVSSVGDTLALTHDSAGPDGNSSTLWSINRGGTMTAVAGITTGFGQLRLGARVAGGWTTGSPNINADSANLFLNSAASGGGVYMCWDQGGGTFFGNGLATQVGHVDSAGNAVFNGYVTSGGAGFRTGPNIAGTPATSLDFDGTQSRIVSVNTSNTLSGIFLVEGFSANFSRAVSYIRCYDDGTNYHVDVSAVFTAAQKNFRITHPLDDTKDLTHSSLEGPEVAVYYRGEAVTIDGVATITLPDYFEALTRKEGRTVQLTELYEDENEPVFGNFLAAGRINNGKFNVRSSTATVTFYWEVKAVRGDVPALEVETAKDERFSHATPPAPPAPPAPTEPIGTPEPRETKPKKGRS